MLRYARNDVCESTLLRYALNESQASACLLALRRIRLVIAALDAASSFTQKQFTIICNYFKSGFKKTVTKLSVFKYLFA